MAHEHEHRGTRWIWNIFWILLAITMIEIGLGTVISSHDPNRKFVLFRNIIFIALTFYKAYYIMFAYMHLREEKGLLKKLIVGPFSLLVYLIFILYFEK